MDINTARIAVTVLTFIVFVAIVVWAWSGSRRDEFAAAARMVLDDDSANANPDVR